MAHPKSLLVKRSLIMAIAVVVLSAGTVFAQGYLSAPESQKRQMGIYFTGLGSQVCATASSSSTQATGGNAVTTGAVILPENITSLAQRNRPVYEAVGASRDVPWQLIAALHYREFNMNGTQNPSNGQGVYQLYSLYQSGERFPPGPINEAEFRRQTEMAVDFFLSKQGANLPNHRARITRANPDADTIKDTFYSYNGRSSAYASQAAAYGFSPQTQPYEGSPYVMNNFDAQRQSMPIITRDGGGIDGRDTRPGAFTVYAGLLGLGGGSAGANCTNGTGNPVADKAKEELDKGVQERPDGSNRGTEIDKYTGGVAKPWSPDFVSWVLKEAGSPFDGGTTEPWRLTSTASIVTWLQTNGQYTTRQDKAFQPQAGDVVIISQSGEGGGDHVGIVYQVVNNAMITIEGNVTNAIVSKTYNNYETNARIVGWGRP